MVLLGLWPFVMRRLATLCFTVNVVRDRVVGTLTTCGDDGVVSYVVFAFNFVQERERRLVTWLVVDACVLVFE